MSDHNDTYWMNLALEEARKATSLGEVPVGAVLIHHNTLLAQAHNNRETTQHISGHAEIQVLEKASEVIQSWRLPETTLYVTVEPCLMCVGAILQARVQRVVFGVRESKSGSLVSNLHFHKIPNTPKLEVVEGILSSECQKLMKTFFGVQREV
jgi:tRNA(adenine34) deaminase